MSTKIRLARHGRKKKPFYNIVVMDSRNKTTGLFKELLGFYDPIANEIKLNLESFNKWTQDFGAIASTRVLNVVKKYQTQNNANTEP